MEQIVALINEYGITLRELSVRLARKGGSRRRVEPRYYDPETGKTWSGRGRRPLWLSKGNLEDYLLKQGDADTSS
ncbi:H-NS family nucleoid-associated regulatory protein [Burkholderia vietnamiensis]|uniref:H-NS histone family protein n=1 Tax=Burkholderia vietnamiensis TaxID=60552 RepID=UPI0039BE2A28